MLAINSLLFANSELYLRRSGSDLAKVAGDPGAFVIQGHQALCENSMLASKHRGDDMLKSHRHAESMPNSISRSCERHLFASARRNRYASLEENLQRVVKFFGEKTPVSVLEEKKDGPRSRKNAPLLSFTECLKMKSTWYRHSDEENPNRSLTYRGSSRGYRGGGKTNWIVVGYLVLSLVGLCILYYIVCGILHYLGVPGIARPVASAPTTALPADSPGPPDESR
jgi:hypothetical protein